MKLRKDTYIIQGTNSKQGISKTIPIKWPIPGNTMNFRTYL